MIRPTLLVALLALGVACGRDSQEDETAETENARAQRVASFWSTYQRGTRERLDGRFADAAAAYREALRIDPAHQDSLFYLAVSLEAEGFAREAAGVLRKLVELYPEHGRGWSQLGSLLATRAPGAPFDLDAAEEAFLRSEAINREHSGPFVDLAKVALERNDLGEAVRLFGVAADMGSPEGLTFEGLVELLQGRPDAAVESFVAVFDKRDRERAISGKGATSEGDVDGAKLTPLESAVVRARVFAYWASRRLGGYPESVRPGDRIELRAAPPAWTVLEVDGGAAIADLDGNGRLETISWSAAGLRSSSRPDPLSSRSFEHLLAFDLCGSDLVDLYGVGDEGNVLLRNEGGRFEDATASSGLDGARPTTRAIAGDFDGDGAADLLEVGDWAEDRSPVRLYLRRGERYERNDSGLEYEGHLVDAAASDVNGDGTLDVFLLGWKRRGRLFLGRGGRFEDATASSGLSGVGGDGPRALFFDFDRDGDPDLLVTAQAPLELSLLRLSTGRAHFAASTPRLFDNDGGGRFSERTSEVGLDRPFGVADAAVADLDGDGFPDLLLAEGGYDAGHLGPSVVLRNVSGRELVEWAYLPSIDAPRRATGIASGDLDGDGRPEIVLSVAGRLPP